MKRTSQFGSALLAYLFILFLDCTVSIDDYVPGIKRTGFYLNDYPQQTCDGGKLTVCTDCRTIKVCLYADQEQLNPTYPCPAATPYCAQQGNGDSEASCQLSPDTGVADCTDNSNTADGFYCTGAGYYPDPSSCEVYHYCDGEGATPDNYDCPPGYKYNSKATSCQRSSSRCDNVNCASNRTSVFTVYPSDSTYYTFCQYNYTVSPPLFQRVLMLSCGSGSTFNPTTQKCEYKCVRQGYFANTANPRRYFQCYLEGGRLRLKEQICNAERIFDDNVKRCIERPTSVISVWVTTTVQSLYTITETTTEIDFITSTITGTATETETITPTRTETATSTETIYVPTTSECASTTTITEMESCSTEATAALDLKLKNANLLANDLIEAIPSLTIAATKLDGSQMPVTSTSGYPFFIQNWFVWG